MFKRALVSVSDKTGLSELLRPLVSEGLKIISTGGTAQFLRDDGFPVQDVSEVTDFPEVMDGRVKTLHPKIHMGLLGRTDLSTHVASMKQFGVEPFDLVIVNLYPFEDAARSKAPMDELIEKIDIGGPSMLRSAAKNHGTVAVLCDPADYKWFLDNRKEWSPLKGRKLAAKVYAHTSVYDALIAQELGFDDPKLAPMGGKLVQNLRYGENPDQQAAWYRWPADTTGLETAKIIQGKELSYNNLLDLEAAARLVREFQGPAVVAVKHNNPCGAAVSGTLMTALESALTSDPVSVFGGIIAANQTIDGACAGRLAELFLECVVAPSYSAEALAIFAKKKNLRILEWPTLMAHKPEREIRSLAGGFVVQTPDAISGPQNWKFHGEKPNAQRMTDLQFGEKVCASLKSNAIALVANGQTMGLGMGQVNRVDAVEQAIRRWKQHHPGVSGEQVTLISDAFFPFADSVELAAREGIRWVLQPGGSVKDDEVLAMAEKNKVNMILTGQRHFRH